MLRKLDPVLNTAMRSYASTSATSPNVKRRAKELTLSAMNTYDPSKGKLRSHLLSRLQRLYRVGAQSEHIISMPEQVALDRNKLSRAAKELTDKLGRPPSDTELADNTNLSIGRMTYVQQKRAPLAQGTLIDSGTEGRGIQHPAVDMPDSNIDAWLEFVHMDLNPTDQYILERSMGMHGHLKARPSQIAKELRLSPAAISHRLTRIQKHIDRREEFGVL